MARTSKDCIFCGGHPTTREHIWADWLKKYIPKTLPKHSSGLGIINADRTVEKSSKTWGGDPRSRQLRIVCKSCNEVWMSQLQTAAKPILVPLIEGRPVVLTSERQSILAAWCAMTVICAEYLQPTRTTISVTDRRWLFTRKIAPKDFRIWIGDYKRGDWPAHWAHSSLRISEHEGVQGWTVHPDGTPRTNTQTTTFVVGRLFIHVYSCPFPEILNARKITDAIDARLVQIWPIHRPPTVRLRASLTDREADTLTGYIFDRLDAAGVAFGV